jgi:hypothetical protein
LGCRQRSIIIGLGARVAVSATARKSPRCGAERAGRITGPLDQTLGISAPAAGNFAVGTGQRRCRSPRGIRTCGIIAIGPFGAVVDAHA